MGRLLCASAAVVMCVALTPRPGAAQSAALGQAEMMPLTPPLPPATKLEAFTSSAGSVVTLGYDDLGSVTALAGEGRVAVDVREMRDARGTVVRGLVVDVTQSKDRKDRSFIDEDEVPELISGIDALLSVKANPTAFKRFEVTYRTRGDFEITAFNTNREEILYSVTAGRTLRAQIPGISLGDLQKMKAMFDSAAVKLSWLANAK
jgi:hypothetical protein